MKSRLIMNLVLLAIIAVLGVVAFLKPGKQKPETPSLLTLDASALTRMTLQNKETLVFEKQDGAWRLTAPFVAPVNQVRAGQLLEVAKARSEANYPLKPEDVAQFGLDKPQAILTLGDATLQFGGTDPINMRRYVRLGDTLHLVDDNFFHHLTAPATDYVDKKLLPEGAKIRAIELPGLKATKNPGGPMGRRAIGRWQDQFWGTGFKLGDGPRHRRQAAGPRKGQGHRRRNHPHRAGGRGAGRVRCDQKAARSDPCPERSGIKVRDDQRDLAGASEPAQAAATGTGRWQAR